jgi:hypothetical protein
MSSQRSPSQRRHWYAKSIRSVPVHVPGRAVSVARSRGVPSIAGASVLAGATAAIGSVEAEVAVSRPPAFVAVTSTRRLRATSADVAVYVLSVAPSMSAQLVPSGAQRRHW